MNKQYLIVELACDIPDGSTVTKLTGNKEYIFKRELKVYTLEKENGPMIIKGLFITDGHHTTQVEPDLRMIRKTTVELLKNEIFALEDETPQ